MRGRCWLVDALVAADDSASFARKTTAHALAYLEAEPTRVELERYSREAATRHGDRARLAVLEVRVARRVSGCALLELTSLTDAVQNFTFPTTQKTFSKSHLHAGCRQPAGGTRSAHS